MMEMTSDAIKMYFDFIQEYSHKESFFLNINRYEKIIGGEKIKISEYPYDQNWKVIYSEPSINQKWIHFLITKRNFNSIDNNIKKELLKISNLGKKYYGMYIDNISNSSKLKNILKKIIKLIFGKKILNYLSRIFLKLSNILRNI
mgnify:CR=1 FL=1